MCSQRLIQIPVFWQLLLSVSQYGVGRNMWWLRKVKSTIYGITQSSRWFFAGEQPGDIMSFSGSTGYWGLIDSSGFSVSIRNLKEIT